MSTLLKIRGLVVTIYLIVTLIVCHTLQIISFVVYPFSPKTCRTINRKIVGFWWGLLALSMEHVVKIKIHLTGDFLPMNENAIILPNHQASADIPMILWLAQKQGMVENLKWFFKKELLATPVIGPGLWLLGCPMVKRNWDEDKNGVIALLSEYKKQEVPIWMITFLEGTRSNPAKIEKDRDNTENKYGKLPLDHHLYPREKGIAATVQGLRTHVSAIYDVEILYHKFVPSVADLVNGQASEITLHLKRTPIEEIPLDDKGIYSWVEDMFREKDKTYARFHKLD